MSILHRATILSVLLGGAVTLPAAVRLSGPVAGYVADPSRPILRAITGVPGAYQFSDPLALPDGAASIRLAPGQDFAIIGSGNAGLALLFLNGGAVDHVTPLAGAMPAADWAAFSPASQAALLYSASGARMQLFTGLPASPQLALDLDTSGWPEQPLTAALSDDGSLRVVASGHAVYRLAQGGSPELVLSAGAILSMALLANGTDLAVADRSTASIHVLHSIAASPVDSVLVSGLSGMGKIYPSSDGASLFVARPGARAVSAVDLASGSVSTSNSPTEPVNLIPLRNRDTFLTSGAGAGRSPQPGSVFLLDGGVGRVVMIPALPAENGQ